MSREEILKMEAGPELDVEIALKVMGWQRPIMGKMWVRGPRSNIEDSFTGFMQPEATMGLVFRPSSDIAHAWMIAEKLRISVIRSLDGWYAGVTKDVVHTCSNVGTEAKEVHSGWFALADSAPLAIVRAALLATVTP